MSTLKLYITGYALSILLTLLAFGMLQLHLNTHHSFPSHHTLFVGFISLAIAQLFVQLFFFLHVGKGKSKYLNGVALGFALFIVFVVVGGTLWIMGNLKHTVSESGFLNGQINVQNEND